MRSLFDAHKKDAMTDEQADILRDMTTAIRDYPTQQGQEEKARWKVTQLARQIGLNVSELSAEEIDILMKTLRRSGAYKHKRRPGCPAGRRRK